MYCFSINKSRTLFAFCVLFFVLSLTNTFKLSAQTTIEFSYDDNGNRIRREMKELLIRVSERDTVQDTLIVNEENATLESLTDNESSSATSTSEATAPDGENGPANSGTGVTALAEQVSVYPNPTQGAITIRHLDQQQSAPLQVFVRNSNSRLLDQFKLINTQDINLRNYANGVYYLELVAPNGERETIRIIKTQ